MYSVFIVDDEPIVLEGIRTTIDWDNSNFSFAGEASDGEIALSMIQEIKPDILITDIKMPFMDGLELSATIRKTQPWIKIIILSGHDEFDYAKKAISIGIEDYLLKPFTSKEIVASLNKAAEEIDKERKQLSDITKMQEELKSTERIIQKDFLSGLVHGTIDSSTARQKCHELKLDLLSRYYKIIISRIESTSGNSQNQKMACSLVNSYSSSWEQTISFFENSTLVCICKGSDQKELDDKSYHIAETIEHIATQNPDCKVFTTIGKTVEHLSMLAESYEDAKKILELSKASTQTRIISSDDFLAEGTELLHLKENDPMVERLKYASKNDISIIIDESMNLIKSNPGQFQFVASYLLGDVIFSVSELIESLGGNIQVEKPEILQRNYIDSAIQNAEAFSQALQSILSFALDYRDSKVIGKYQDVILKAKKYIAENYADQNTTLTKVADVVALSPNHFSTIFSQECNTTFIEYLTNVRIENAKRLLRTTDMKGYDIAYECGFSDPHYFSYIFKKNTGLSPREYKTNL